MSSPARQQRRGSLLLSASFDHGVADGRDQRTAQRGEFEEGDLSLGEIGRAASAEAELGQGLSLIHI